MLSGLLVLCSGGGRAETGAQPFAVLRTPAGYVVLGIESSLHIPLQGQTIRSSNLEGMAFFIDEHLYQVLVLDPTSFAPGDAPITVEAIQSQIGGKR